MWFWWEAWMANEYLDNLAARDMLKVEAPSTDEVSGLVRSGAARLEDAKNDSLSLESRFDLAYNAAHASSLAALRIAGYRSNDRCLVFQCLEHTLDLPSEDWRVLDQAHRKRNLTECEGTVDVNEGLVEAVIRVTEKVALRVSKVAGIESSGVHVTAP